MTFKPTHCRMRSTIEVKGILLIHSRYRGALILHPTTMFIECGIDGHGKNTTTNYRKVLHIDGNPRMMVSLLEVLAAMDIIV